MDDKITKILSDINYGDSEYHIKHRALMELVEKELQSFEKKLPQNLKSDFHFTKDYLTTTINLIIENLLNFGLTEWKLLKFFKYILIKLNCFLKL